MTQKGFEKEIRYQAMLSICRAMLGSGVISMDEFRSAERLLREKYQPIFFCSLLIQFTSRSRTSTRWIPRASCC